MRMKKTKRTQMKSGEIQSGKIREADEAKLKQGERQMKPIRDKI
jgi:hypothetical protein